MRPSIIVTALTAGIGLTVWQRTASAQGVEVYVGPPATYDSYYDYRTYRGYPEGPRVYGYSYEPQQRHLRQPEHYRTGSRRWWKQMDRTGRGGHQD